MIVEVRNANAPVAGVDEKPPNSGHRVRKAIVSGEVVNISVYSSVYKTVYGKLVEPRPHTNKPAGNRLCVNTKLASNAPHFRLVG